MLGQQAGGVQRRLRVAGKACGLELDAQGNRATAGAQGQLAQAANRFGGIAVVQCPAGRAHLGTFANFHVLGVAGYGQHVQGLLPVLVAQGGILQGVGGIGGDQMGRGAQALAIRQAGLCFAQRLLGGQGGQSRFAGAQKAAGLQVRECFEQALVHATLFLLHAPAACLVRHLQQHCQGTQRGIKQQESQKEQSQGQVQRHVHPVGRPEPGDRALVIAGKQCHGHGHGKQTHQPQGGAHFCVLLD